MRPSITVAIVTRNRAKDLEDCLASLSRQDAPPGALLIVDNASSDNTADVVRSFLPKLPIRLVHESVVGFSAVYNRALREATTEWVAFIDSDCAADSRWYGEVVKAAHQHPQDAALVGPSCNHYGRNAYACAFQFSNDWYRWRAIKEGEIVDYDVLDSRNIVYNASLLRQNDIRFDDSLQGSEDVDIGLQIFSKGLKAKAIEGMIVYHKEPRSMGAFFSRKLTYTAGEIALLKKWGRIDHGSAKSRHAAPFYRLFASVATGLSIFQKILCALIIAMDIVMTKRRIYFLILKMRYGGSRQAAVKS